MGRVRGLVSNKIYDSDGQPITDLVTNTSITDGSQKTQITNGTIEVDIKNNINTGNNELLVNLEGHQCLANTSTEQLEPDGVFLGSSWQDTLDYGVLSINVNTDVDSAIDGLEIQWSNDGITANEYDYFSILANKAKTFTFGPAERYYRVKYTNGSSGTTTSFHLTSLLRRVYVKPSSHRITDSIVSEDDAELTKSVLTGINPDGIFNNVGITTSDALRIALEDGQTGARAEVEPLGSLKTVTPTRVVGTAYSNGVKDTNFWTETVTGTGSITQSGEITLATGITANSTAKYTTVRKARKITGTANQFRAVARNVNDLVANCVRRIGPYDTNNGFFMQYDGTTFSVVSRKNTVDNIITNGNFNGNAGTTIDVLDTNFIRLVITYTALSAKFFVNEILIHTIVATTSSLTSSLDLPVTIEIFNKNGSIVNNSYQVLFASILTLGNITTQAKSVAITTNATTVLKYGAGILQRIVNTDNAGRVYVYDNTSATGKKLVSDMDTTKALSDLTFNSPFDNGLTIVTTLGAQITVIYE